MSKISFRCVRKKHEHLWKNSHSVYRFTSNEHCSRETWPFGRAYWPWKISVSIVRKNGPHSHQRPDRVKPWRRRRKLFRSKTVSCKVDRNTETVIVWFFAARAGFQKRRNFFQRHTLLINQSMHICPCSWALGVCKNSDIGIQTYFGSVTAEYVEFYPLGVCKYPDFILSLLHLRTAFFVAHLLCPLQIW